MKAPDNAQSAPETLLTVKDVMELFQISQSSVYRMIEKRLVRFYKINSGLRFQRSDIDSYLLSCRTEAMNEHVYESSKN